MATTKPTGKNSSVELRIHVVALKQAGLSYADIKRLTGKDRKFVQYWIKRSEAAESLQDRKRIGRPRKLDANDKRTITRLSKNKWNRGSRTVTKLINGSSSYAEQGKHISQSTVLRYIRSQPKEAVATISSPDLSSLTGGMLYFSRMVLPATLLM